MTPTDQPNPESSWFGRGDINAFFGLMLDNVSDLILMASLLVHVFKFPADFVLTRMIPGTAIGVLVGDLLYSILAIRLARRTQTRVTAMPLGLDTPSTFGMVFLILGPAFLAAKANGLSEELAAEHAWYLGVSLTMLIGLFKVAVAPVCTWLRRIFPRAGLLGSLAAIGMVLISFLPFQEIFAFPTPGLVALVIILATLTAGYRLPGNIPGALASILIGMALYYGMGMSESSTIAPAWPHFALPLPMVGWFDWFIHHGTEVLTYIPLAFPLALATVVGGIDCVESAEAAGDSYPTGLIVAGEGISTLAGALFGGVIQSTPYIGHPAYKAMDGRSGYTIATALFIGAIGVLNMLGIVFLLIPRCVVFPILVFVGLEITSQSFRETPHRHYPAMVLGFVPSLAYLIMIFVKQVPGSDSFNQLSEQLQLTLQTLTVLSNGFLITSLLWTTLTVKLIDGRPFGAAIIALVAAGLSLFGIIHSPLPSASIGFPSDLIQQMTEQGRQIAGQNMTPWNLATAYTVVGGCLVVLGLTSRRMDE